MELERLFRQFDGASFAQRAQLAAEAAAAATPAELDLALAGLTHEAATVRLGVIELMRAAQHHGAVARLHAHAQAHAGDGQHRGERRATEARQDVRRRTHRGGHPRKGSRDFRERSRARRPRREGRASYHATRAIRV